MGTHAGNSGVVNVGAAVVAEVTDFSYDEKDAIITKPDAVGDTAKTYIASGVKDGSGSINCVYDDTDTTGQGALTPGASVTLNLYPYGTTTGSKYLTGNVVIASVGKKVAAGSMVTLAFAFNGVLTEATA